VISSPRLNLRTLTAIEAERLLNEHDPDRPVFGDGYPSAFVTQVLRLVALYPATDNGTSAGMPDLGPWLLVRRTDDAIIGAVSCARTADPSSVSVGYDIAPSCWGQGYATEALSAVSAHLLSVPAVWRVCAETRADHVASRRVMEKAGMRWLRDEVTDGLRLAHYAIDRPEPF
jgi:RimJ/RimL family protein N-acetyltransferase